MTQAAKP